MTFTINLSARRSYVVLALLGGVMTGAAAVVWAQTTQVIYACYVPESGTIYRIKEKGLKKACISTSHVEFNWNNQGPPGPPGPQGPPGPAGTVTGREVITELLDVPAGGFLVRAAFCPAGKVAVGGGYSINSSNLVIFNSGPSSSVQAWQVAALNTNPTSSLLGLIYAVCVTGS